MSNKLLCLIHKSQQQIKKTQTKLPVVPGAASRGCCGVIDRTRGTWLLAISQLFPLLGGKQQAVAQPPARPSWGTDVCLLSSPRAWWGCRFLEISCNPYPVRFLQGRYQGEAISTNPQCADRHQLLGKEGIWPAPGRYSPGLELE